MHIIYTDINIWEPISTNNILRLNCGLLSVRIETVQRNDKLKKSLNWVILRKTYCYHHWVDFQPLRNS